MTQIRRDFVKDAYLSPYYKVVLGGRHFTHAELQQVEEVMFEDTSTGSDLISLTIRDPEYTFLSNYNRLKAGTPCMVAGGYLGGRWKDWINGFVSSVDPQFPEDGFPTLTLHIMDQTYRANKVEKKRVFRNMTYAGVASKIAKEYGWKFSGHTTGEGKKKHETISQSYQTDIQFLSGLADSIGYMVFVKSGTLYFRDMDEYMKSPPTTTLWYRRAPYDVFSFSPRIIEAEQMEPEQSEDFDEEKSTVTLKRNFKYDLEATASISPIIELEARQILQILGVGVVFSGKFFINSVVHTITRSGYSMELELLRKNFKWPADNPKPAATTKVTPKTAVKAPKTHTVKKGESLWVIAKKYYGDGKQYMKIYNANKGKIKSPDSIQVGQVLTIP